MARRKDEFFSRDTGLPEVNLVGIARTPKGVSPFASWEAGADIEPELPARQGVVFQIFIDRGSLKMLK